MVEAGDGLGADFVAVALGVRVGPELAVGESVGVTVGVVVAVAVAVGGLWVVVGADPVAVGEGALLPPALSSSFESTMAAAIPTPSARSTTPMAMRIAGPLTPWEVAGAGALRSRAVGCRERSCGGRPGGAATLAAAMPLVAGIR